MLLAVVVFGLCSCEDDKDPVLQKPTEFVLNQPATSELAEFNLQMQQNSD